MEPFRLKPDTEARASSPALPVKRTYKRYRILMPFYWQSLSISPWENSASPQQPHKSSLNSAGKESLPVCWWLKFFSPFQEVFFSSLWSYTLILLILSKSIPASATLGINHPRASAMKWWFRGRNPRLESLALASLDLFHWLKKQRLHSLPLLLPAALRGSLNLPLRDCSEVKGIY